jgi:hypothetical protein
MGGQQNMKNRPLDDLVKRSWCGLHLRQAAERAHRFSAICRREPGDGDCDRLRLLRPHRSSSMSSSSSPRGSVLCAS